jgi:hypothetical protein
MTNTNIGLSPSARDFERVAFESELSAGES